MLFSKWCFICYVHNKIKVPRIVFLTTFHFFQILSLENEIIPILSLENEIIPDILSPTMDIIIRTPFQEQFNIS